MDIVTRKEAREKGLKRYFTGKPCRHGHIAERRTDTAQCCECLKIYQRGWYQKNREKKRAYYREYYKK